MHRCVRDMMSGIAIFAMLYGHLSAGPDNSGTDCLQPFSNWTDLKMQKLENEPATDFSVRILGHAPGAEGREIVWKSDTDDISSNFMVLDRTVIDSNGQFQLQTDLFSDIRCTYLEIDYYSASLFVETGRTYHLEFSEFNYDMDEDMNAFIVSNYLPDIPYMLVDENGNMDKEDLNFLIGKYSYSYQNMLAQHFEKVTVQGDTTPIMNFLRQSEQNFKEIDNAYFQDYRRYYEAGLKDFAGIMNSRELFEVYIDSQDYHRFNPAQRDFYKVYFTKYFQTNRFLPFDQFRRIINQPSYTTTKRKEVLLDSMGIDYRLRNEKLREWVLILGLSEEMWNERLNVTNMTAILRDIANTSKFKDNATAASNFLKSWKENEEKRYFKDVLLRDTLSESVKVEDLLEPGKFHYFIFTRSAYSMCPSCQEELNVLQRVWKEVGDNVKDAVRIITVNCDYSFDTYLRDAMIHRYPWVHLNFNKNIDWIRKIDAARFPSYFLVDDKGRVLNSDFNAPSQNIGDVFRRMATLKSLHERRKAD